MTSSSNDRRLTHVLRESIPALLRFLERRVGIDDAPDLLGETLVVAWRRVDDLPEGAEQARMWLFGIARGTTLNYERGKRRHLALIELVRRHLAMSPATAPADAGAEVRDAVARLDDELGEIVKLVHWDGFTLAEVAELIGIPETTVRSRYRRARETLRQALDQQSDGAPQTVRSARAGRLAR